MNPWTSPEFLAAVSTLVVSVTGLVAVILRRKTTTGTTAITVTPKWLRPFTRKGVK